jgi:ABC-2 type transport system ATP-binding protein
MLSDDVIIETIGLTKIFSGVPAVHKLDLEVHQGEIFGFLGPNASGKTTTTNMLLGLVKPSAGRIKLFREDMGNNYPFILPRVGAVLDTPAFYPYLSGKDNLKIFSRIAGHYSNDKIIDEKLETTGLTGREKDKVREYSLGMKQRLAMALSLLNDPELLIFDEPTNGLDPFGIIEVRTLIRNLSDQGKTIFLSSHLLHEVEQVCTNVALINKGNIIKTGAVKELLGNDNKDSLEDLFLSVIDKGK